MRQDITWFVFFLLVIVYFVAIALFFLMGGTGILKIDTDILMYLTRVAVVGPALIIFGVLFDVASPGDWSKAASSDPRSSAVVMAAVVFGIAWAVR